MPKRLTLPALLVIIALAVVATSCGNTSTTKTEKIEGVEWNVTIRKAVQFYDTQTGVSTENKYTLADTVSINQQLLGIKPENLTLEWTIPSADGSIWLVAYENGPILSEKVAVTEANTMPSYGGNIQVAFKFADADKWATITRENIGSRLAVFVNSQLMNAPQVNNEITSGNCSVTIPGDMIKQYLLGIDLEKIKQ